MPNWKQVLAEIQIAGAQSPLDQVRRKYLKQLHEHRGRNVICYYSGWLQRGNVGHIEINDSDKNGFMATVHGLNRKIGLDLLLHTPGGDTAATESLVEYLRAMFDGDIEVFVPQLAMSAGTMICCAARRVYMGKQSSLGPVDPQFSGVAAQGVIQEYQLAQQLVNTDPRQIPIAQVLVGKYPSGFIIECFNAIRWSEDLVRTWLESGMFREFEDKHEKASAVAKKLMSMDETKAHNRHLGREKCREYGLIIDDLESKTDEKIQDLVLTVHHTYMHTFSQAPMTLKIVENHAGQAIIQQGALTQHS